MSGPHFLIRSPPHPDESGLGYLARLAFVNGRRSVLEVVDVPRNKITLSELAYRIGIPITVLRCALPPWPAWIIDRWGISGLAGRLYFNLKRMRFCPYCFAEAPYLSQAPVKLFSVACPIHRVVSCCVILAINAGAHSSGDTLPLVSASAVDVFKIWYRPLALLGLAALLGRRLQQTLAGAAPWST